MAKAVLDHYAYDDSKAEAFLDRIAAGDGYQKASDGAALPMDVWRRWRMGNVQEFGTHMLAAEKLGAAMLIQQAQKILDEVDFESSPSIKKAKYRADFLKWRAAKLDPIRWGDARERRDALEQIKRKGRQGPKKGPQRGIHRSPSGVALD